MPSPLVAALIERQHSERLTARAFAARLGTHEATWSRIRAGKQRPPRRFLLAALTLYPELQALVIEAAA